MDEQTKKGIKQGILDWLDEELQDTFDEDYELELSESELSIELKKIVITSYSIHYTKLYERG